MYALSDDQIKDACLAVAKSGQKILAVKLYRALRQYREPPGIHESVAQVDAWLASDEPPPDDMPADSLGGMLRDAVEAGRAEEARRG